jgi:hypothetical protein
LFPVHCLLEDSEITKSALQVWEFRSILEACGKPSWRDSDASLKLAEGDELGSLGEYSRETLFLLKG